MPVIVCLFLADLPSVSYRLGTLADSPARVIPNLSLEVEQIVLRARSTVCWYCRSSDFSAIVGARGRGTRLIWERP